VSILRIEGVAWSAQRILTALNLGFLDPEPLLSYTHEAEWTPFQSHYFSENLVAPGIEPGTGQYSYLLYIFYYYNIQSVMQ
jgi:hypothetical protein